MNYIYKLQKENAALKKQVERANEALDDINIYCHSSKFFRNTYIEKGDIILRVREAKQYILNEE